MLEEGKKFPDFKLPDQNGVEHNLAEFSGKWLVVYFYPKDNTSGCTLEAQAFAGLFSSFHAMNTAILGVSKDSVKSHCNFAAKYELPFTLLSDPEVVLMQEAGVWQLKKMAGREYMGTVRSTAIVDPDGLVRAFWTKVKASGHAEAVHERLQELQK